MKTHSDVGLFACSDFLTETGYGYLCTGEKHEVTGSYSKLHYIQYLRYNRVKKNFLKTGCER